MGGGGWGRGGGTPTREGENEGGREGRKERRERGEREGGRGERGSHGGKGERREERRREGEEREERGGGGSKKDWTDQHFFYLTDTHPRTHTHTVLSVFFPKAIAGRYTGRAVQHCSFFYWHTLSLSLSPPQGYSWAVQRCSFFYSLSLFPLLRTIAGLFNVAHEMSRGSQDPSFPRLGQMFTEYDHALRKISEDFIPLAKVGRKGRGGGGKECGLAVRSRGYWRIRSPQRMRGGRIFNPLKNCNGSVHITMCVSR